MVWSRDDTEWASVEEPKQNIQKMDKWKSKTTVRLKVMKPVLIYLAAHQVLRHSVFCFFCCCGPKTRLFLGRVTSLMGSFSLSLFLLDQIRRL